MVEINHSRIGNKLEIIVDGKKVNCIVVEKPFYDPKKKIATS
jgi:aminomethyltransferase